MENTTENRSKKLRVRVFLSLLTVAIGALLMVAKIYADGEPGLIPLLLVVLGIGSYLFTRAQIRSHHD